MKPIIAIKHTEISSKSHLNARAKIILDLLNKPNTQLSNDCSTLEHIQVPESI